MVDLLLLFFANHVLGDFYLQSDKMAQNKNTGFIKLLYHALLYTIPFAFTFITFSFTFKLGVIILVTCFVHFVIDLLKFIFFKFNIYKNYSKAGKKTDWSVYLIDQSLHILSIFIILIVVKIPDSEIQLTPIATQLSVNSGFNFQTALRWFLLVLCIYKPTNITFVKIFSNYKPESFDNFPDGKKTGQIVDKKAGAIIGFLERMLIIIFISLQQYSAIGLILTAKSIARYENISKSQDFAEYYLIGTLTSVLFSVVLYRIII